MVLVLVLLVSLSEQGFPPHPAPVRASTPYCIQSREQEFNPNETAEWEF